MQENIQKIKNESNKKKYKNTVRIENIEGIKKYFKEGVNSRFFHLTEDTKKIIIEYIRGLADKGDSVETIAEEVGVSKSIMYNIVRQNKIQIKYIPTFSYEDRQKYFIEIEKLKKGGMTKIKDIIKELGIDRKKYALCTNKNSREGIRIEKKRAVDLSKDERIIFGRYKLPDVEEKHKDKQKTIYNEFLSNKTVKNNISIIAGYVHKEAIVNIMCGKHDIKILKKLF